MQQPPTTTMKCSHCGDLFTGNPRSQPIGADNYCSIKCEEGRGPKDPADPSSPDFPQFVQGEPTALIGYTLLARGRKLCDYSPDWHRQPEDYGPREIVWHDPDEHVFVKRHTAIVGRVVDYEDGKYIVEQKGMDYRVHDEVQTYIREYDESLVLSLLRNDTWWCD